MSCAVRRSARAIAILVPLLVMGSSGMAGAVPPRSSPVVETVPGNIVVRFRGAPRVVPGARFERPLGDGIQLLRADPAAVPRLVAELQADPDVEWAEPDRVRRIHGVTTNDPLFKSQWSLPVVRVPDAWVRTRGSAEVVVAVVDTGILPHPDLEQRYLPGYDFVTKPDSAGDGDARDEDPTDPGTDSQASSALHGLHVTGIIAAHVNNSVGMAGIDWNCRILPVRVLGVQSGKGSDSDIADGIRWAGGLSVAGAPMNLTPAAVINLSFGGPGGSAVLQAAVDAVTARGVIVVASAGNDGADTAEYAPAGLNHVIAVGALDEMGVIATYSNRGPRVDLMAPGGSPGMMTGILSTTRSSTNVWGYVPHFGTSQAAPHVSGVAALMRAVAPALTPTQARNILVATADPTKRCMEGCGAGLLDANGAVAASVLQSGCLQGCEDGQVCRAGYCVAVGAPIDLIGGCAAGGRASDGRTALLLGALLVALLGGALALRRARRV